MKKILIIFLSAALLLSMCVGFCSCGEAEQQDGVPDGDVGQGGNDDGDGNVDSDGNGENSDGSTGSDDNTDEQTEEKEYSVLIKSVGGMPIEDVEVYFYCTDGLLDVKSTDGMGRVRFVSDAASDFWVELDGAEKVGYVIARDARHPVCAGENVISVATELVEGDLSSLPVYGLGDIICDFEITDVAGKTYTVSEILAEKELLVLNFWYVNCNFCVKEFPYMCSAYDKYSDKVEIFAINDYGDSKGAVESFSVTDASGNPVEINFPMFRLDSKVIDSFDGAVAYPVTVCIDRYGMISMVHVGGILSEEPFLRMFEFYTSPDYVQTVVEDVEDIIG